MDYSITLIHPIICLTTLCIQLNASLYIDSIISYTYVICIIVCSVCSVCSICSVCCVCRIMYLCCGCRWVINRKTLSAHPHTSSKYEIFTMVHTVEVLQCHLRGCYSRSIVNDEILSKYHHKLLSKKKTETCLSKEC